MDATFAGRKLDGRAEARNTATRPSVLSREKSGPKVFQIAASREQISRLTSKKKKKRKKI